MKQKTTTFRTSTRCSLRPYLNPPPRIYAAYRKRTVLNFHFCHIQATTNMAGDILYCRVHTLFDGMACPRCDCNDAARVTTVVFGDVAFIRSCSLCNWAIGIDDSVNHCDLGEESWEFKPNDGESGSCSEGTNHRPICMGFSKSGLVVSRCTKCKKTGTMFYKGRDFNSEYGEFQNTDVFGAMFKNIAEESGISDEPNLLSDMLKELEEVEELRECMPSLDIDLGDQMVVVCDCGNGNPELFNKTQNSVGSVMECLVCSASYSPDLDANTAYIVCEKCQNNVDACFAKTYESGKLTIIKCLRCDTAAFFSHHTKFENPSYIHKDRVTSWDMIERGNHISWQRNLSYEHHAI